MASLAVVAAGAVLATACLVTEWPYFVTHELVNATGNCNNKINFVTALVSVTESILLLVFLVRI